ncbi:MAG: ABC transporter permease subunit [Deinococcota bacterium]
MRSVQKVSTRLYLGFVALALVGPFVPLMIASLAFRWSWPDILPSRWWWQARGTTLRPLAWDYLAAPVSGVPEALVNTVGIALVVALLAVLISLPAARALAKRRVWAGLEFWLLTPLIVPEIAIGLGMATIFLRLGLAGNPLAVVLAHLVPALPYTIRTLTAAFQNYDTDYEAQARSLGAGTTRVFWHVTLPLLLPSLLAAGLFAFIISSNIFLLTFFVGRGSIDTLPTLLFAKLNGGASLDAVAAGLALLVALPGLILMLLGGWGLRRVFRTG